LDGARRRLKNNSSTAFSQLEIVKTLQNIKRLLLEVRDGA
jgi:hypothetical protein